MEDVIYMIEGYRKMNINENFNNKTVCLLKCLKLTGIDSNEREGVTLISHPAILPLYVLVPIQELHQDVPEEFSMTCFERYMHYESKIGKIILTIDILHFFKINNYYLIFFKRCIF